MPDISFEVPISRKKGESSYSCLPQRSSGLARCEAVCFHSGGFFPAHIVLIGALAQNLSAPRFSRNGKGRLVISDKTTPREPPAFLVAIVRFKPHSNTGVYPFAPLQTYFGASQRHKHEHSLAKVIDNHFRNFIHHPERTIEGCGK